MTIYGIHTNAQGKSIGDLRDVWSVADDLGYGWISISDHLPGGLGPISNEAVATHAALALTTRRARCGVLAYAVGLRHPAVLASAVTTIDHLSGGRAAIGLGSGSVPLDHELYGLPFPPVGARTDRLEAVVELIASLLHDDTVDFEGDLFQVHVSGIMRPLQDRLPVWVGTGGERRGLRIVARHADGWNLGFPSPETFTHKRAVLHEHCAVVGRDPAEVQCSVNLQLFLGKEAANVPDDRSDRVLAGSVGQVIDRIGAYVDAGADQVNLFLAHPWDLDGLEALAGALGLPSA
jgi:alkanesulfonate monooxygenase SsuD/methylene tetrahydromethanopterin reductase-like flavin-dependent oxidoreductase (luciferase family)